MEKIKILLGKKILLGIAGMSIVAGGVYIGVMEQNGISLSPSNTKGDASAPIKEGDSTYINTQWNDAVGGTKGMPENWPKDAPVAYAGATLMSSLATNPGTSKPDPSVIYFTDASGAEIIEYYVKSLETNGWKIEANADSAGYRVITAKKDTRSFAAFIGVDPKGKTGVTSGVTF